MFAYVLHTSVCVYNNQYGGNQGTTFASLLYFKHIYIYILYQYIYIYMF